MLRIGDKPEDITGLTEYNGGAYDLTSLIHQ